MTTTESVSSVNEPTASPKEQTAEKDVVNNIPDTVTPTDSTDDAPVSAASTPTDSDSISESEPETITSTTSSDSPNSGDMPTPAEIETPSIEELTRQLTEATQKADGYWDNLLRKQAEYDNLQKRMTRELENARKYALEKFTTELLSIKDSMELGLEAATKPETSLDTVSEGIALTLKMLGDTMSKFGVMEINPQNEKFDPQWHEAMAMQPTSDVEEGMVLHVHQKGYQLNERLLRPARVIVAKAILAEETEKSIETSS